MIRNNRREGDFQMSLEQHRVIPGFEVRFAVTPI
jgi:hypothetical protein